MNLLWLYLFQLAPVTPNPPAIVGDVEERWGGIVDVDIVSIHCGFDNAAYYPGSQVIVMCDDLYNRPALARFILAHELGHAVMWQYQVPQREGTHDQERVADELAFFMSDDDEVTHGARWFLDLSRHAKHDPADEHPDPRDRAAAILCLGDGRADNGDRMCKAFYDSTLAHWVRIFDGYVFP